MECAGSSNRRDPRGTGLIVTAPRCASCPAAADLVAVAFLLLGAYPGAEPAVWRRPVPRAAVVVGLVVVRVHDQRSPRRGERRPVGRIARPVWAHLEPVCRGGGGSFRHGARARWSPSGLRRPAPDLAAAYPGSRTRSSWQRGHGRVGRLDPGLWAMAAGRVTLAVAEAVAMVLPTSRPGDPVLRRRRGTGSAGRIEDHRKPIGADRSLALVQFFLGASVVAVLPALVGRHLAHTSRRFSSARFFRSR
jgi:hypothetical protein